MRTFACHRSKHRNWYCSCVALQPRQPSRGQPVRITLLRECDELVDLIGTTSGHVPQILPQRCKLVFRPVHVLDRLAHRTPEVAEHAEHKPHVTLTGRPNELGRSRDGGGVPLSEGTAKPALSRHVSRLTPPNRRAWPRRPRSSQPTRRAPASSRPCRRSARSGP